MEPLQPGHLQPAYVLHARDYRDTSLLIDFFTPAHGRVAAVARGARSVRRGSSQRAILQPGQPLWVSMVGSGELKSLRDAEVRAPAWPLRGQRLFSALYLNELLSRLLHRDDAHIALFSDYENTLQQLAGSELLDIVLRHFELRLLDELGYALVLDQVADSGEPVAASRLYQLDAQGGLIEVCGRSAAGIAGAAILDFLAGNYSLEARRALKHLCRRALRLHLGPKPLRSRELFGTS